MATLSRLQREPMFEREGTLQTDMDYLTERPDTRYTRNWSYAEVLSNALFIVEGTADLINSHRPAMSVAASLSHAMLAYQHLGKRATGLYLYAKASDPSDPQIFHTVSGKVEEIFGSWAKGRYTVRLEGGKSLLLDSPRAYTSPCMVFEGKRLFPISEVSKSS